MKKMYSVFAIVSVVLLLCLSCTEAGSSVFGGKKRVNVKATPDSVFATKDSEGHIKDLSTVIMLENAHFTSDVLNDSEKLSTLISFTSDESIKDAYDFKVIKNVDDDENHSVVCLLSAKGETLASKEFIKEPILVNISSECLELENGAESVDDGVSVSFNFTSVKKNKENASLYRVEKLGDDYVEFKNDVIVSDSYVSTFYTALELLADDSFNSKAVCSYNPLSDISSWFYLKNTDGSKINANIRAVVVDAKASELSTWKKDYINKLIVKIDIIPTNSLKDNESIELFVSIPKTNAINSQQIRENKDNTVDVEGFVKLLVARETEVQKRMYFNKVYVSANEGNIGTFRGFHNAKIGLKLVNVDDDIFSSDDVSIYDIFTITSSDLNKQSDEDMRVVDECYFSYEYDENAKTFNITIEPKASLLSLLNRKNLKCVTFTLNVDNDVSASFFLDLSNGYWKK